MTKLSIVILIYFIFLKLEHDSSETLFIELPIRHDTLFNQVGELRLVLDGALDMLTIIKYDKKSARKQNIILSVPIQ